MTRRLAGLDRVLVLLAGLVLLVAGAGAIAWWAGQLAVVGPVLDAGWLPELVRQTWWPWASTAAAVVLALFGLRWLAAHLPRRTSTAMALDGSGDGGRLDADLGVVAQQAATALATRPGLSGASSRVTTDRGQLVIELTASVPATGDLPSVARAVDATTADLARVLDPSCPAVRTWVRVARP